MIIPWQDLDSDTLNNLLEHFVLREGTEYGEHDVSLADKVDEVRQQLKQGLALIVYSELHESINIVSKATFSSAPVDDIAE
ncbi:YheU family protein [Aeromonas salmonicida]|uniref:YheU family protein n=1 Tax=Aeromonas salmonicida TaxID=645 RepID=UPI00223F5FA5|nr:YheU family protein [Aeromonas salmonicida]